MKLENIDRIEYEIDEKTGCFVCTSHHTAKKHECPGIKINGRIEKISRYVYTKTKGQIPNNHVIRHTCDNPQCINPDHLISGTHSNNVADRVLRERSACGEYNGRHKLTKHDVIAIYFSQNDQTTLSKKYNIDRSIIRSIWYKRLWKSTTQNFLPMWHINRKYYLNH